MLRRRIVGCGMAATNVIGEYLRARRELVQPGDVGVRDLGRRRPERTPAAITQLIMSWPTTPAYVFGRYLDVLAANALATALAPWFTVGENLVKGAFLDPRRRELRPNWERSLGGTVAAPRANVGPDLDDPRLTELVGELSLRSQEFRQLWARHDVRPKGSGTSVMHHPQVGRIELFYTKLPIPDTDRHTLSIYHAAPGTPSERGLALLATTTVREREPDRTLTD